MSSIIDSAADLVGDVFDEATDMVEDALEIVDPGSSKSRRGLAVAIVLGLIVAGVVWFLRARESDDVQSPDDDV